MKNYEIKKQNRAFGSKRDWYNMDNLGAVEAVNPTYRCGKLTFPAAYFVFEITWIRDDMREFQPVYKEATPVAGPFSCEANAKEWAEMHQ